MESPKSNAAKLLQSKQGTRQKLMVFVGLALAVVIITTTVFALHAQAMNYTRRVLECAYEVHEHTLAECGEPDARTCGLADYVVHTHNADCYDEDGKLVCPLKAEPEHKHTAACYEDQKVLTCEQDGVTEEEAAALIARYEPDHVHTDDCYVPGERVLSCGQEEREAHAHTEACYAAGERVLSCGQTEQAGHTHDGGCYTSSLTCDEEHDHTDECYTSELSCGQEEQAGHAHTDACYSEGAPVLACGQDEHDAHAHTDECYKEGEPVVACNKGDAAPGSIPEHTHTEACYETVSELTCGKLELHTHDDECYWIIKPEDPEYANYKEAYPEEAAENKEIRILTCEIPQLEEHVHGEECFTEVELSADEIAALKAQEMGIELRDLQVVYEDADVRVTVDYDTLSLVPESAEVSLVNAATPLPEPTPNPLLPVEGETEAADDAALPETEGEPAADAEPAGEAEPEAAVAAEPEAAPEAQPVVNENEAPAAAPVAGSSEAPEVVRAGLMAEGREWLPAATVTYTVQYMDNGMPVGEAAQYVYTPGGEMPTFPRSIARYYRECRTDEFIVTARYTEFAQIPEEAELRASIITDEEQVAAYESAYKEALNTSKAQMLSLLDIGFWMDDAEVQPAAPVSITVQLLGEDGLPAGSPLAVVHFGEQTEVLAATSDDAGVAAFNMNGFSPVGIGQVPNADDQGRVLLSDAANGTFEWTAPNGLYHVTFQINGVAGPYKTDDADALDADAAEAGEDAEPDANDETAAPADGEEAAAGELENAEGEEAAAPEDEAVEIPLATASLLEFRVEQLGEDDEAFEEYMQAAEENAGDLLDLSVMQYILIYNGVELDLSNCSVLVTVTPTMQLEAQAETYIEENPADNGDDDGDGYVQEEDVTLPAPDVETKIDVKAFVLTDDGVQNVGGLQLSAADAVVSADVTGTVDGVSAEVSDLMVDDAESSFETVQAVGIVPCADESFSFELYGVNVMALSAGSQTNPTYTVQYYANLDVMADSGAVELKLIDTNAGGQGNRDKVELTNSSSPSGKWTYIYLNNNGQVQSKQELTEVYTSKNCEYFRQPGIRYADKLRENGNYTLKQIWVLKNGKKANSTTASDWNIFTLTDYPGNTLHFTNRNTEMDEDFQKWAGDTTGLLYAANDAAYLYIKEGAVLRFVYDVETDTPQFDATFYDYDITENHTSGGTTRNYTNWEGQPQGINNPSNYSGKTGVHLAFGNANTATGMQDIKWSGYLLNRYNNSAYRGCTFGLVSGLNADGTIRYSANVAAPNLFNDGDANGKKTFTNEFGLQFSQSGDTYTLEAVMNGKGANGYSNTVISGLTSFNKPQHIATTGQNEICDTWTNNFWPMDVKPGADGLTGDKLNYDASLSTPYYSSQTYNTNAYSYSANLIANASTYLGGAASANYNVNNYAYLRQVTNNSNKHDVNAKAFGYFPASDDSRAHNNLFGMQYAVQFELVKDYCGPLNYYFFGDDDMWVFLKEGDVNASATGSLVCDIGGVHLTAGEYVNLWDYIPGGANGHETKTYTLYFFFTERGLSGSTCWMQFTLPSVTSVTPQQSTNEYGDLRIDKELFKIVNGEDPVAADNGETFKFTIEFQDANGKIIDDYASYLYQQGGNGTPTAKVLLWNNSEFELKANEYILIKDLPVGATYTIKEIVDEKDPYQYDTVISTGSITRSTTENPSRVDRPKDDQYTTYDSGDSREVSGTIAGGKQSNVLFKNTYTVYAMPETGGVTAEWYVVGGAVLALAAAVAVRKRRKKART